MHDLGIFLHFQTIPELKKTIFLKPAWSTDALYKVLDAKKVKQDCGRFSQSDLKEIWHDAQYADVQGELLALMKEFEVCYEITGYKNNYISPHLLEDDLPEEHQYSWDDQNNLYFTYHYAFKPKNIFPRLIVALHRYIEKQTVVWKHGVVLSTGTTRAEIIEENGYARANITLKLSGTDKKRLLAIIGHELENIHSGFDNLKCTMLVPCNCSECEGSQSPHLFDYDVLQNLLAKRKFENR